jgi:NAD(P)-dependent dehydrogenase (short-subunit alcohol dehydrogenase family)
MANEMQNKIVMVTGATNGIGLESARALAAMVRRSSGWGAIREVRRCGCADHEYHWQLED